MSETITIQEWRERAAALLGEPFSPESFRRLTFVCPRCGNVASVEEFIGHGAQPDAAAQNCIGRYVWEKGCDWAAYGVFNICATQVDFGDGARPRPVFAFGDPLPVGAVP